MSKPGYVDLQETDLRGPRGSSVTIKVGEQFCWINPEIESDPHASAARRMIKDYGAGPFVLDKITRVPAGHTLFTFTDENGNVQEITRNYFTTHE